MTTPTRRCPCGTILRASKPASVVECDPCLKVRSDAAHEARMADARAAVNARRPVEERREEIVRVMGERAPVTVGWLAVHFGVSSVTIRDDLRSLIGNGRVERVGKGPAGKLLCGLSVAEAMGEVA